MRCLLDATPTHQRGHASFRDAADREWNITVSYPRMLTFPDVLKPACLLARTDPAAAATLLLAHPADLQVLIADLVATAAQSLGMDRGDLLIALTDAVLVRAAAALVEAARSAHWRAEDLPAISNRKPATIGGPVAPPVVPGFDFVAAHPSASRRRRRRS